MKKTFKAAFSLLLVLIMTLSLSVTAFAADPVADIVYEGRNKLMIYPKANNLTTTDLFGSFKNVMPGDERTETITFKNQANNGSDYVKLIIKGISHDAKNVPQDQAITDVAVMNDFLAQLHMTVKQGSKVIYDGTPEKQLTEGVELGTFKKGEGTTLTVTLTVPLELGNAYADMHGEVDWQFIASEFTEGKPPVITPGTLIQTGQMNWPIIALAAAGVVLIVLGWIVTRKKRHDDA